MTANASSQPAPPLVPIGPPLGPGARKLLAAIADTLTAARRDDCLYGRSTVVIGVIRALQRDAAVRDDDCAVLAALLGRQS